MNKAIVGDTILINPDFIPDQVYGIMAAKLEEETGQPLSRESFEARFDYLAFWKSSI